MNSVIIPYKRRVSQRLAAEWDAFGAVLATIRDIILIVAQAHAAAELYDDLRHRTDADLADRGLKRANLPRVAFNELTKRH